ncbi:MAG: hypothetical protein FWF43_03990 [Propionibacteriaceae bacterium]|nr:hypothetical protein [Propionibacteriaceae bacterium]
MDTRSAIPPPTPDRPQMTRRQLFSLFGLGHDDASASHPPTLRVDTPVVLGSTRLTVSEACTSCSACVQACSQGALRLDDATLWFQIASCSGCGACVNCCPQHAITLSTSDDTGAAATSIIAVHTDDQVTCRNCGQPVGSRLLLAKVTALLGQPTVDDLCPDCKASAVLTSPAA